MTLKDLILGVVGLAVLVVFSIFYGSFFISKECWHRVKHGEWRMY